MRALRNFFAGRQAPGHREAAVVAGQAAHPLSLSGTSTPAVVDAIAKSRPHFVAQRYAEALAVVDDGLAATPTSLELLFARGSIYFAWERFHEALPRYQEAAEAGLVHPDLDMSLGWTCFRLGRLEEAEAYFRKAVAAAPDSEQAWIALANLLETRGTLQPEAGDFVAKLSQWPQNYRALILLAACRFHVGDREGGTETFRQATVLDPTAAQAWSNLGVVLGQVERYAEGLEALQRAFDIDRANGQSGTIQNYATALREAGRINDALRVLEDDLIRNPDPNALWMRSMFLLESGRLAEGWIDHEFRWMKEPLVSVRWTLRRPVWGGQDLHGKTILLHAEQGFGDAIQFVRYARLLKARGARVLFDAFKGFQDISKDFDDVDQVMEEGALPAFDFHIPLLSLPRVLGTTPSSIPAHVPYVRVRPDYRERWSRLVQPTERLKVGLAWAGNPKHLRDRMRSIAFAELACLKGIEGVQFYSLQKGSSSAADIASCDWELIDLGQRFENFCDTAAAISHLDLVISVDTSVAHLAGALAKPVWLMVATPADWRWGLEGERTPWYPTMRIFRQRERNRWQPVVDEIAAALRHAVASRSTITASKTAAPPVDTKDVLDQSSSVDVGNGIRAQTHVHPWRVDETRYGLIEYPARPEIIADSLRYYGEYRHLQTQTMGRFVRPGGWVLESDAGFGMATLFLAEAVGTEGHVIAYESDPLLNQLARQNLSANHVRNVTLLARTLDRADGDQTPHSASSIPGHRIDTVDGLRLQRLDWIAINDGFRCRAILDGAGPTLWRLRPWIFVRVPDEDKLREAAAAVCDYGYSAHVITTPLFNAENYNGRTDDRFDGKLAVALLAVPEEIDVDVDFRASLASPS